MNTRFQSPDQVRWLLEEIGVQITKAFGDKIAKEAKEGLEEKRRQCDGNLIKEVVCHLAATIGVRQDRSQILVCRSKLL